MIAKYIRIFLIAVVTATVASAPAMAKKSKQFKTVAVVVNPACLESFNEQIVVSQGETDGIPDPVMVSSLTPSIMGWVHCPLTLQDANPNGKGKTFEQFVVGVELCHREDAASSIGALMLTRLDSSDPVLHLDDAGFPTSDLPTCILSPVAIPFTAHDAMSLDIKLNFGDVDPAFFFSTIRIILSTKADSSGLSEPSEPSIESVSAPSGGPCVLSGPEDVLEPSCIP
ncbi:MAG: hypothetical protein ACU833_06845 [Gammaproteobacteria bacterium]